MKVPEVYNIDRNVHASNYDALPADQLLVTSIFPTLQGEGPFAGEPAVFLRLAGCNFGGKGVNGPGCTFCDTYFEYGKGQPRTFSDIYEALNRAMLSFRKTWKLIQKNSQQLVVITGGEPTLQNNLTDFIRKAPDVFTFQIETNGARTIDVAGAYVVWSPKAAETLLNGGWVLGAASPRQIEWSNCLKMLISANPESPYFDVPHWVFDYRKPIWLSPICVYKAKPTYPTNAWLDDCIDREETSKNYMRAAQLALRYGFRLSTQQHLFLGLE